MSEDYRRQLEWCLTVKERIPYSYEAHCREVVLEELRACVKDVERGHEQSYIREEAPVEDMLWILTAGENMKKGPYHDNQPSMDVAIVAPPGLMALLMGEYELAIRLCQDSNVTYWKNKVDQVYISDREAGMGSCYSFGEACLLCEDMPAEQLLFFAERGYFDISHLLLENRYLYQDAYFWPGSEPYEGEQELLWRPIHNVKKLSSVSEDTQYLLALVFRACISKNLDTMCPQFWERLFDLFTQKEDRVVIMEVVHSYFHSSINYIFSERFQKALVAYFQYEERLPVVGAIEKYIVHRVIAEFHKGSLFQDRLVEYFGSVKSFEGSINREWQEGMLELLKLNQEKLLALGFRCRFLKAECLEEYVEHLAKESPKCGESYVPLIVRLIQMKWQTG